LETKVVINEKDNTAEIWVNFQEFRATLAEKVPV
jgi:hypothetical protein